MDVPPCLPPQQDHQGVMKLPPPDHYGQPLPPLQLPSEPTRAPPPVTLYSNMPLSPTGKCWPLAIEDSGRLNCAVVIASLCHLPNSNVFQLQALWCRCREVMVKAYYRLHLLRVKSWPLHLPPLPPHMDPHRPPSHPSLHQTRTATTAPNTPRHKAPFTVNNQSQCQMINPVSFNVSFWSVLFIYYYSINHILNQLFLKCI